MKPLLGTEETDYGVPRIDGLKQTPGDPALTGAGLLGADAAEEPALLHLDQQEQLSDDLVGLVAELKRKLGSYLAITALLAPDESSLSDSGAAVAWMEETIDDLVATVVGVQAASPDTAADPVSPVRAVPDIRIA